MRPLLKIGKYISVFAIALIVLAIGAFLSFRAYSQHSNAKEYAIRTSNGISEGGYVKIGGIEHGGGVRSADVLHSGRGG